MNQAIINITYLVASVLFILGIKGLTHPRTAVRGNLLSALGMLLAVLATLVGQEILGFWAILAGLLVGSAIGAHLAVRIEMTAMPQLVAVFNGLGGGASILIAGAALMESLDMGGMGAQGVAATAVTGLIGAVTFWGSFVAFAKLQRLFFNNPIEFPAQRIVNAGVALLAVVLAALMIANPDGSAFYWLMVLTASVLGVLLVIPIGGADMPVVIALLNSYSGLAGAATGFVLGNNVLIISGSLVGASGIILTQIMCKAMNRSLANVLFGGALGPATSGGEALEDIYEGKVKSTSADELAMILETATRVCIVPGYGMAVAQAQHAVREMATLLEKNGTKVEYGIHPVAGRMPGHMNVLLAEAEVPYEQLREMDSINPEMGQIDVVIVIGANDVVNPLAKTDPSSPIAGMPVLDVDKARTVVVIKRSLSPGFAKIPNPLFAADNTLMFFEDGKKAVVDITAALKDL